ncbi:ClpP/crotonase-like domain-containing protein [Xylariales sp. PMI_506]|nr:ClpP/crotonase-like domain-containing protein [Xylariales sp. PMI_506]
MAAADTEADPVHYEAAADGITTITLDRSARRNAVNPATATKLRDAFLAFEADATQNVCVFHGANGTFCAGFDLLHLAGTGALSGSQADVGPVVAGQRTAGPMGPSRMTIAKPVVCAVSGYAVAGGLELSLLGDVRVAEEDAVFGVFCRRFGVPLIDGGTVRLQSLIGLGRAMDMILTGRAVGASEALAMGLANRVVPKGEGYREARKLAELIASFPQACMNVDRRSTYYAAYEARSFDDALAYEYEHGIKVVESESVRGAAEFRSGKGRHGAL